MSKTTRRKFTLAEKALLVDEIERQYRAGSGSIRAIAQSLGIADASYYNWVRPASGRPVRAGPPRRATTPTPSAPKLSPRSTAALPAA